MKYIFSFLIFISLNQVFGIDSYQANESLNVLTLSGIKLRDKPGGIVLQSIPYAAKVVTLEVKNNTYPVTVEGINGSWVKVNFNGKIGYVFDGFLSRLPAPSLTDANLRAYAKREFKTLSEDLPLAFMEDNDLGSAGSNVVFFEWNNQRLAYSNYFYYEGGSESMCIPGISIEEGYLLMRILERDAYEYALKEENHPEGFDMRQLTEFLYNGVSIKLNDDGTPKEVHNYYTADLTSGCDFSVTISKKDQFVIINVGGGC